MAIRIIKKGKVPEKKFQVTCRRCGTEYEFLDTDAHREYDNKEHEFIYGINCPLCNEFTYVSEKNILKQRV
jgi:phage terminase large subunit GpA-like protein